MPADRGAHLAYDVPTLVKGAGARGTTTPANIAVDEPQRDLGNVCEVRAVEATAQVINVLIAEAND